LSFGLYDAIILPKLMIAPDGSFNLNYWHSGAGREVSLNFCKFIGLSELAGNVKNYKLE